MKPRRDRITGLRQWIRILLRGSQLIFSRLRQVLYPAVVDRRDRQNALSTHACKACDVGIFCCAACLRHLDAPDNLRIRGIPVETKTHDNQGVGKLAGDIDVVPAPLLGAVLYAMASAITGQSFHDRIHDRSHDRNRAGRSVGCLYALPIWSDSCLIR